MWSIKTAPKSLAGLLGNELIGLMLHDLASTQDIPSLLIGGPTGCGKTTAVNLLINELYPTKAEQDQMIMYINGSINRTSAITTVDHQSLDLQENIPQFIKTEPSFKPSKTQHKLIVVFDVDSWMENNLLALRSIMELNEKRVRFILVTHDVTSIIEAIQSRCVILNFRAPSNNQIAKYLQDVWKYLAPPSAIQPLDPEITTNLLRTNPSLRSAINQLQLIAYGAPETKLFSQVEHWISLTQLDALRYLDEHLKDYRTNEILEALTTILIERNQAEQLKQLISFPANIYGLKLICLRLNVPPS